MKFRRKNKGFTLIETIIVLIVVATLAAIAIGNTGDMQQKAQIEMTSGEIRDFLIETGATAGKIQKDIAVLFENNSFVAKYYDIINNQTGDLVENFEGGRTKSIYIPSGVQIEFAESNTVNITEEFPEAALKYDNLNKYYTSSLNFSNNIKRIIIRPKGRSFTSQQALEQEQIPYFLVKKGKYSALVQVYGTGNINMFISRKERNNNNNEIFYPIK